MAEPNLKIETPNASIKQRPESGAPPCPRLKLVAGALVLAGLFVGGKYFGVQELLRKILETIADMGVFGGVIFIVIYALSTVLFLPGWILTLGAGVIYGVAVGSAVVSIGSTFGAVCAFLSGRYIARDWVSKKIQGNKKFKAIDDAVAREGWKIVGLTRLSPAFPFNLLNYAFGVTKVSFRDYFLASWIGMAPGTIMYVYIGSLAGSLATLGADGNGRTPMQWALYLLGLAATVAVTIYVTKIAKEALADKVSN